MQDQFYNFFVLHCVCAISHSTGEVQSGLVTKFMFEVISFELFYKIFSCLVMIAKKKMWQLDTKNMKKKPF